MIEIYVGAITPDTKPYLLPQTLLESTSDYFVKALRSDTFKEGREGRLHFPDDDIQAWESLLFWLIKRELPDLVDDLDEEHLYIKCWALGDKYGITTFQDEAMLELLRYYSQNHTDEQSIALALKSSAPGSKMRRIIAEELVILVNDFDMGNAAFEALVDGMGIIGEFLSAQERRRKRSWAFGCRFAKLTAAEIEADEDDRRAYWKDYLVGEPPKKHWAYELEEA